MNNIEFKNIITPIMDVSKRLSEFEEDEQLFLTTIKNLDSDYLERMKIKYKKDAIDLKGGLKPVNFLRYIIVDKILKKDIINIETINQFKELIRNKDVSLLTNYSDYKDAINKFGEKDSFKVWSNFRILFYIYYNKYKDEGIINSNLSEIIKILQESLDLENTNISINEFDWNQNFGTSKSWIALYPKNIKKHKDAYQIFMSFENNKIKYGLYPGYNLSGKKILILSDFNSINYLDIINYFKSNIIPKYIEFNKNIKKSNMSKNVKSEQENTELIFNAAKLLKDKKQIILYGPPGTGKTWNTKRIIEKFATEEYDDLKKEGRVEFITFHQSYAYEEFIEGIKPELEPENDNITYNIKPGVFKKICNDIEANFKSNKIEFEISKDANIFKLSLGNTLDKEDNPIYDFCKNKNVIALGWGQNIDFTNANSKKEIEKMIIEKYGRLGGPNESNSPFSIIAINYFKNKMKINDYVLISNGNKKLRAIGKIIGDYEYHDDYDIEYTHFRKIKWVNVDLDVDIKNINKSYFSQMTIYELNR